MGRSLIREEQIIDADVVSEHELTEWVPEHFTVSGTLTLSGLSLTDKSGYLSVDGNYVPATSGIGYSGIIDAAISTTSDGAYNPPAGNALDFVFTNYDFNINALTFDSGVLTSLSEGTSGSGIQDPVTYFIDLADVPNSYTGATGRYLTVSGNQIVFTDVDLTGASGTNGVDGVDGVDGIDGIDGNDAPTTFSGLTDTPDLYDNGKYLKSTASGTEWAEIITPPSTFLDLTDTPAVYDDGKYLRATTSGIEWAVVSGTGGGSSDVQTFLDLTDTPSTYSGAIDKYLKVTATGIGFSDISAGTNDTYYFQGTEWMDGSESDSVPSTTSGYTGSLTVLTTTSGQYEAPPATQIGFNFTIGAEIIVDENTLTFENGLLTTVE